MADPHSSATPSSSMVNRDVSGTASSSSSGSQVQEEEYASGHPQFQSPDLEPQHLPITYRIVHWVFDHASSIVRSAIVRSDTWSCVMVLFTFWSFVSVIMIMGVYGSMNLLLTPNSSMLIQPNPLFVQHIKVENLYESKPGIMLHGTYGSPSLDVVNTWTETCNVSIPTYSRKEWKYYLNRGSQVNISYHLNSKNSTITLVITEGDEGLAQWLDEPKYPNNTISWNVVKGTGMVTQDIYRSSSYYVAVGNTNEEVEVKLNIRVRAFLYNTTDAYYKCALTSNPCGLNVFFPDGNAAVLTSSGSQQNTSSDEWHIKLSCGPRWITYIFGICGMTWLMLLVFNILDKCQIAHADRAVQHGETATQRAPLLSYKDDHLSRWGSSYESIPHDEEDLDFLIGGSTGEKSLGDGETSNNTQRLCAICFDAARDCFFLPCGHCVACFACGTRIAEAAGTCPVCRRNTKKVRKIFTV